MLNDILDSNDELLRQQAHPEFLRIGEAVAVFRLSKAKIYQLISSGKIRSICLRERGQVRGTRLIVYDSLREYLFSKEVIPEDAASSSLRDE